MKVQLVSLLHWTFWLGWTKLVDGAVTIPFTCSVSLKPTCKGKSLGGTEGDNLNLKYTFGNKQFSLLKIYYNNTNTITIGKTYIREKIKNKRLIIAKEFKVLDDPSIEIMLKNISLKDHNAKLKYEYSDENGDISWENSIVVKPLAETGKTASHGGSRSDTVIIAVIVVVAVIIIVTGLLIMLVKRGIITPCCCKDTEPNVAQKSGLIHERDLDEKIYASPETGISLATSQPQTEYAALGPGGGRAGPRNELPQKSMYAQVKTENGYYPDLDNYAEPRI